MRLYDALVRWSEVAEDKAPKLAQTPCTSPNSSNALQAENSGVDTEPKGQGFFSKLFLSRYTVQPSS